jgi:predicted ATPase/DNA-binding SARP family transcriptional activator
MARPFVQLMGRAGADAGAGRIDFVPERRYQLLAYLAYARDWVDRDRLAHLFWSNVPTATARGNLRSLIDRARDLPCASGLEADRHRVRWLVRTDVESLEAALADAEAGRAEAVDIAGSYTGAFADGLEGYADGEYRAWVEVERSHLHGRWRSAMLRRAEAATHGGDIDDALALLERLLASDRLDEEAVQRHLVAARARPWRDRALRIYRDFARALDRELGLAPSEMTRSLVRQLEEAAPPAPASDDGRAADADGTLAPEGTESRLERIRAPAPGEATEFIGRVGERVEVAALLAKPACRLVTLTGPGGIGKTRLARQVAHDVAQRFAAGVVVLSLGAVTSADAIPGLVAEALDITPASASDPLALVAARLDGKSTLVVLDSLEHLEGAAAHVSALLERCPAVRVLVTTRERLNLEEEWVMPIVGLPCPRGDSLEEAVTFDAVRLFEARVRRVLPAWSVSEEDAASVGRLCRLLQGSPLGIELAAVWVRVLPCDAIVNQVQSNLDFLAGASRNAPPRHASIRATFEHSWNLLLPVEQNGLRALAVFRGGVTREGAAAVAGVTIPILAALVDKSLLRVTGADRYDSHPLIGQFMREKLAIEPEREAHLRARHAEHYLRLLIEWGARLDGPAADTAVAFLEQELANVLEAWQWAIHNVRLRDLQVTTLPLQRFFARQQRGSEGAALFRRLAASLSETDPEHRPALGYSLLSHGYFLELGHPERMPLMESGLALLRTVEDGTGMRWGLYMLGVSAEAAGDRAGARAYVEEGLALATEQRDARARGDCLTNLARLAQDGGDYGAAIGYAREAVAVWEALGDANGETWAHAFGGLAALRSGRLDDAASAFGRGYRSAHQRHDALQSALLTAHQGLLAHARGEHDVARTLQLASLEIALAPTEEAFTRPMVLADLARIEIALGRLDEAEGHVRDSLARAEPYGWPVQLISAIAALAALEAARGATQKALELAHVVIRQAAAEHVHVQQMEALVTRWRSEVPTGALEEAAARAASLGIEDVARTFLHRRPAP